MTLNRIAGAAILQAVEARLHNEMGAQIGDTDPKQEEI
jgi:hypothetical protein